MKRPRRTNAIAYALYANAVVLLGILMALLFGGSHTGVTATAFAEPAQQAPIAGGAGVFVMPAQLRPNLWGCYLIDVDRQTLCTYEYQSGEQLLKLTSARDFRYDLQLKNFNTFPYWFDVKKLVDDQAKNERSTDSKTPQATPEAPENP